jgi:RNA polymerase sigma-54 factor
MLAEIRALDPRPGPAVLRRHGRSGRARHHRHRRARRRLGGRTQPRHPAEGAGRPDLSCPGRGQARDAADREFLAECLQSANWLTRSLDQRARSIIKVASEIVRRQDAFLCHGVRHLKPLNLRMVAEAVGMHESTVSRVSANKYMMTPRGVFELRYFFSGAIPAAPGGEAHSSEAVRIRIRDLIGRDARKRAVRRPSSIS